MTKPQSAPIYIDLPPFFVNQSRMKAYQDCDRLYGWQYIEGLTPDRPRKALEIGTAIHAAQVVAHAQGATEEGFVKGLEAAELTFRAGMGPIKLPGDEADLQEGLDIIKRMLPAYYQHWKDKGQLWKPLGMELKFCVEVGEESNIFLVGRIDNLVTFMGSIWLVDYKTMGRLDMRDFLKFEIDIQLTAYIYGATKQLSIDAIKRGEPPVMVRGAIIDGMVKTQIPQFHRELYTRTVDDLREFELEFVEKAREIQTKHLRVQNGENWKVVFPKHTDQCFKYGTCPFRDLCVRDNETRRMAYTQRGEDYVDSEATKLVAS